MIGIGEMVRWFDCLSQGWLIKRTVQKEPFVTKFPFILTNLVFGKVVGEWPKYVYTHTNNVPLSSQTGRRRSTRTVFLSYVVMSEVKLDIIQVTVKIIQKKKEIWLDILKNLYQKLD